MLGADVREDGLHVAYLDLLTAEQELGHLTSVATDESQQIRRGHAVKRTGEAKVVRLGRPSHS